VEFSIGTYGRFDMDEDGCDSRFFDASKYMVIEELKRSYEMASSGYASISDTECASLIPPGHIYAERQWRHAFFKGPWWSNLDVVMCWDLGIIEYVLKINFSNFPKG
jgi:hypothetical protein